MSIFKSILLAYLLFIGSIKCTSQEQILEQTTLQPTDESTSNQMNKQSINHHINQQISEKSTNQRCDDARLKCAFRLDCGQALTSYMIHCADLIAGTIDIYQCPSQCFKALIALASTEQGSKLVDCDCGDSQFCKLSKERVEVCRDKVEYEIADNTVVSCSTAKFICSSNTQCLTALTYYNKFCKAMFKGKFCSKRCLNSLNILQRQKNAYKLRTCICDGTEDFPCEAIKQNTESLCLKKANITTDTSIELLNSEDHRPLKHHHHHLNKHHKAHHHHKFNFEHRRPFLIRNRQRHYSSSADFDSNQFETSPIDLEQIKNFKYFDVMISEALSSNGTKSLISNWIYFLISLLAFVTCRLGNGCLS